MLVIVAAVCGRKRGELSKFLKIIQPLAETEVGFHSKNLLDTIDGFNGSTGETKTVFSGFALSSGKKKIFLSVKILGKIGVIFFGEIFIIEKKNYRKLFGNFLDFFVTKFLGLRLFWGTRVLGMYEY